jgi:hypothetical protein
MKKIFKIRLEVAKLSAKNVLTSWRVNLTIRYNNLHEEKLQVRVYVCLLAKIRSLVMTGRATETNAGDVSDLVAVH